MTEHRARKRFGQNFLTDHGIIHRIARSIKAGPNDHLVEIGPGQGALTDELLAAGAPLDAIELDRDLVPILQQRFADEAHFTLHQGDALAFDFASLQKNDEQLRIVGNLPYNISTPLIFHLLTHQHLIKDMHFMLQLEVVQRMSAQPSTKNYGRLGIMCQYYCKVEMLFEVPPESFDPKPKVQSAIVRLTPHQELPHVAKDLSKLDSVLRTTFNMRRKTLRNSLKQLFSEADIEALGIDPSARPETLSLEEFVRLSNAIS
ncbi:16S rRNA (adenine(1518)-N(6)/adenine(1519)-N(6))-dimethyltransferase RsmA [Dasania marina]|uniref:16S rRNA (adenine(1518)-N(6)/adenine(1519)-N(6))- dimethyltransferase RsmA n=1 Tax=Dasania marina TaxID=471499 RepID=UPI00036A0FB0|nr:16S rRNA (adenine(1518)-N(6)/adenine(1519)-N(6))-dimethyltransferase RsmA [Dasania marina]|tara:strand:+ start:7288 stop:8067 length:780 start_codon:yes stop_codon:yes gene_type:complete